MFGRNFLDKKKSAEKCLAEKLLAETCSAEKKSTRKKNDRSRIGEAASRGRAGAPPGPSAHPWWEYVNFLIYYLGHAVQKKQAIGGPWRWDHFFLNQVNKTSMCRRLDVKELMTVRSCEFLS